MKFPKLTANFYILLFAIALVLTREACHCFQLKALQKELKECQEDALIIDPVEGGAIDTTWKPVIDTTPPRKPKPSEEIAHRVDSIFLFEPLPFDTAAVLQRYFTERRYRDSIPVEYGSVLVIDTLFANGITGRSVITDFKLPVITKTEIHRIREPKRGALYAGIDGLAGRELVGLGGGLLYRSKTDQIFQISAYYTGAGTLAYTAGARWKIAGK